METSKKIGIQGGQASYHEQVALHLHPDDKIIYCDTFGELFTALKVSEVGSIVVAISNTHIGPIAESATELARLGSTYTVLHRVAWPVHHALLGLPGAKLGGVQKVYSQLPAFDQCRAFLTKTLPAAEQIEQTDTALSAKRVAEAGDKASAAIASEAAGRLYGLQPIVSNIQDDPENVTNFIELVLKEKP